MIAQMFGEILWMMFDVLHQFFFCWCLAMTAVLTGYSMFRLLSSEISNNSRLALEFNIK
jgi:hypothetical protein